MASEVRLCNLPDGYWRVPAGKLATATVWLSMRRRPAASAAHPLRLDHVPAVSTPALRQVFNRIGAASLWDKTIELNAKGDAATWGPESSLFFAYDESGRHVGLLELIRRDDDELAIEIEYLGLFPEFTGRGLGKRLMAAALEKAWNAAPTLVQVHTCHFDHAASLPFYLASGFTPVASGFQIMDDPRLRGWLPRDAAPRVPLIGPQAG